MRRVSIVAVCFLCLCLVAACPKPEAVPPPVGKKAKVTTLQETVHGSLFLEPQVIPTVDGGAYFVTQDGMWYLKGNIASKVKETAGRPNLSSRGGSNITVSSLWVGLQVQRAKCRELEAKVTDLETGRDDSAAPLDSCRGRV